MTSNLPAIAIDLADFYTVAGVLLTASAAMYVVKKVRGLIGR